VVNADAPSWKYVAKQTGGNFDLYSYEAAAHSLEPPMAKEAVALTRKDRERQAGVPPQRDDLCYAAGSHGDEAFRADRRAWFQLFTGTPLEGTLAQQNEQCDAIARRFRAYGDGRMTVWERWA